VLAIVLSCFLLQVSYRQAHLVGVAAQGGLGASSSIPLETSSQAIPRGKIIPHGEG